MEWLWFLASYMVVGFVFAVIVAVLLEEAFVGSGGEG
jgi:hypothetical protein